MYVHANKAKGHQGKHATQVALFIQTVSNEVEGPVWFKVIDILATDSVANVKCVVSFDL